MIRWATIVAKSPQWVDLKLIQQSPCQGCTGQCHRPLFKLFSVQENSFRVYKNHSNLKLNNSQLLFGDDSHGRQVGQQVGLQIQDSDVLAGGFQFYVVPLLAIIVAMICGHFLAVIMHQPQDLFAFLGFVLALIWILFRYRMKRRSKTVTLPKVTIL